MYSKQNINQWHPKAQLCSLDGRYSINSINDNIRLFSYPQQLTLCKSFIVNWNGPSKQGGKTAFRRRASHPSIPISQSHVSSVFVNSSAKSILPETDAMMDQIWQRTHPTKPGGWLWSWSSGYVMSTNKESSVFKGLKARSCHLKYQ